MKVSIKQMASLASTRQTGITMIEVLVTILVVAIGLLGVATMQANALKSSVESSQRTAAAGLANDIIDRIRANPQGARASSYIGAFSSSTLCNATPAKICASYYNQTTKAVVAAVDCTGAEMATFDAWELRCGYDNADGTFSSQVDYLSAPVISVVCTDADASDADSCSSGSAHTVRITWSSAAKSANRGGTAETQTIQIDARI